MSTEQWLENGDCKQCRRQKYCSKSCKRHVEATRRMIRNVILKTAGVDKIAKTTSL